MRVMESKAAIRLAFLLLILAGFCLFTIQPIPGVRPGERPGPDVDASKLEIHVRLLSTKFSPRDYSRIRNLDAAAAYIKDQFSAAGGRTSEQVYEVAGKQYRNVIAKFGPDSGERIVVGAHYDVAGPGPGADDNASGVAGLIELAWLLGKSPSRLATELVAYTLEEPPYYGTANMGSAHHASSLRAEGIRLRAMISLEMIGYFTDAPGSQQYPFPGLTWLYSDRGDFVALAGDYASFGVTRTAKRAMKEATALPIHSITGPAFVPGTTQLSDHMNYRAQDYPAIMVTDTSFFRNPNYHMLSDTADTLDYKRMARVMTGVYAAVIALGE